MAGCRYWKGIDISMNQITLLGRLTKDPEMRYSQSGTAVTRFVLAVKRDNNDKADFIYCIVFGKQAESTAQYCKKGRQILLSGRLEINVSKNEQNNQTQSFTTVIANRIEFLAVPGQHNQQVTQQKQQPDQSQQNKDPQQLRFQPGPNGWENPDDSDLAY